MFSKRYGTGERVIVGLHGWAGDHRTFEPLERWRPESVSLYSFDLPGYGKSNEPLDWNLPAIAKGLAEEIDHLGIDRFTLVGNCSGAVAGLYLAGFLRDRIDRFILIDPFAYFPWYFKLFLLGKFGRYAYFTTFATPVGRLITNGVLQHRRTADSDLTASFADVNHHTVYRYLQMMDAVGGIQKFGDLLMPIDLVYGDRTFGAVERSIEMWSTLWPHAAKRQLRGAGHLPIQETPQQLAEIVFAAEPGPRGSNTSEVQNVILHATPLHQLSPEDR